MGDQIIDIIRWASNLSVVLPIVLFFFVLRKSPPHNYAIATLVIVSAVFDVGSFIMFTQKIPTVFAFNLFNVIQFGIISWFFYEVMFNRHYRPVFFLSIAVYLVSLFLVSTLIQGFLTYQNWMWCISGLFVCSFSLRYFNHLSKYPPVREKNLNSLLYFNGGLFVYFAFSFLLFAASNYILTELGPEIDRMAWSFHNINNIIKNVALALGMYYTGRTKVEVLEEVEEKA